MGASSNVMCRKKKSLNVPKSMSKKKKEWKWKKPRKYSSNNRVDKTDVREGYDLIATSLLGWDVGIVCVRNIEALSHGLKMTLSHVSYEGAL